MRQEPSPVVAACAASGVAGPVFVTSSALAYLYLQIPQPIVVDPRDLQLFFAALLPAALFGFLLAFMPNLIVAGLMTALSRHSSTLRLPAAWAFVGGGSIYAAMHFAVSEPIEPPILFGLTMTAALCALICWRNIVPHLSSQV